MSKDLMVRRRDGLIEAEVDGEMVGLHVDKGTCYGFNSTATRVWSMIESPKRLSELRDALVGEFDVEPEVCEAQLVELLRDLETDGLVEMQPVDGGA